MGYYSDVALSMYKKDYNKMVELNKENEDFNDLIRIANKRTYTGDEDVVTLYWESVKWHTAFPEIGTIEDYLRILVEQDRPYNFIRIGEDWDDVEYNYHYSDTVDSNIVIDKISLYRAINIDE